MQRRSWLKGGVVAGAVLALGGGAVALWRPGWSAGRLTPAGRELFEVIARVVLEGLLPDAAAAPAAYRAAMQAHLERVDATIAAFAPSIQAEIAELTALLLHPAGRYLLTGLGSDWSRAEMPALRQAMQGLRESRLALRQQAYHALRDLSNGAYFAGPETWPAIGYPGPRAV